MANARELFANSAYGHGSARPIGGISGGASEVHDWGISMGPCLWLTRLRILFVLDDVMTLGFGPNPEFGLGPVLDTLRDRNFAWWVRFEVDVAWRGPSRYEPLDRPPRPPKSSPLDPPPPPIGPPLFGRQYVNFRFTQAGFDLDKYDQVWFFGYSPSLEGDWPLRDEELRTLAEWMDRGGGVLGTGDHWMLGAALCSRIPRVRTMRKWTDKDGVLPSDYGESRNDTLQPSVAPYPDAREGDFIPKPIEPVYRISAAFPFRWDRHPHPILCAPQGVIEVFPDHMHEGEVIEDDEVKLNRPLEIPGYQGAEYPPALPKVAMRILSHPGAPQLDGPRPTVIAHASTTHQVRRRFPLIGVYDGDSAGVGRVVVDSTWHHWLSMNLYGFMTARPEVYELMQAYYRNIALWLARRQQRAEMLYAATWGVLVGSSPMKFHSGMSLWHIGELALDVIGRTASQCHVLDWAIAEVHPEINELFFVPTDTDRSEPCTTCLSIELFRRAMVGGIGTALLEPALECRAALGHGEQPRLDGAKIGRRAAAGAEEGYRAFTAYTQRVIADDALKEGIEKGFRPLPLPSPAPFKTTRLRIVAERLQLSDPADALRVDGSLTLTVRVRLDRVVSVAEVVREIAVPEPEHHRTLVVLDLELGPFDVHDGAWLTVEVLDVPAPEISGGVGAVRFTDSLEGDPSEWIGAHRPHGAWPWRLWYRIEGFDDGSSAT